MRERIIIKKPVFQKCGGGRVRLTADIIEPGKPIFHTFIEVEEEYAKYLSVDRADYLLYLVFPVAIREGYDVVCEAPVTEMLLHNIREILIPHFLIGDKNAKQFDIYTEVTSELIGGEAVGTGVSCGVDSTFNIMEYTDNRYPSMQLSHLFIASVNAELWDFDEQVDNLSTWEEKHKSAFDRYHKVSEMTGLPLVKVFTNIVWYVCKRDWGQYHHLWVHNYATMASVLSLRKLWKIYYFASTWDFISHFQKSNWLKTDPEDMALVQLHIFSLPDFKLFSGGVSTDRIEKTRRLADYDVARKTLHPCHKQGKINCSDPWCTKCARALFAFDYYDKLDEMTEVFDIKRYKDNKKTYFWYLAGMRHDEYMEPTYELIIKKYPEEMKIAVQNYDNWAKPIPRADFDILNNAYMFSLKLLTMEDPKGAINKFFKTKGVKRLYCSGTSNLGKVIVSLLDSDIDCITYQTGKCSECDAVYILTNKQSEINNLIKRLHTDRPVYTNKDIESFVSS